MAKLLVSSRLNIDWLSFCRWRRLCQVLISPDLGSTLRVSSTLDVWTDGVKTSMTHMTVCVGAAIHSLPECPVFCGRARHRWWHVMKWRQPRGRLCPSLSGLRQRTPCASPQRQPVGFFLSRVSLRRRATKTPSPECALIGRFAGYSSGACRRWARLGGPVGRRLGYNDADMARSGGDSGNLGTRPPLWYVSHARDLGCGRFSVLYYIFCYHSKHALWHAFRS